MTVLDVLLLGVGLPVGIGAILGWCFREEVDCAVHGHRFAQPGRRAFHGELLCTRCGAFKFKR